jgi:hypothetical protein
MPSIAQHFHRTSPEVSQTLAVDISSGGAELEKTSEATCTEKERPKTRKTPSKFDPNDYELARKRLKKAMLEHYRGLEALNNYRVTFSTTDSILLIYLTIKF